jgi:transposase-like protein
VKAAGRWRYVYRAIDQFGQVIDVLVSSQRDAKAARRFFEQAISTTRITPVEVGTGYRTSGGLHAVAFALPRRSW